MSYNNEAADFFSENASTGGGGAPSFKFANVGDVVKGKVVSTRVMPDTDPNTGQQRVDKKTGKPKQQMQVILETKLRNWAGCKPRKNDDGSIPDPSEDTGARAIYLKGGWMINAVAEAVKEATDGARQFPAAGDIMAVMFSEEKDTGKMNPLKLYKANVKAAPEGLDEEFFEAEEEQTNKAVNAAESKALNLDDDDDDIEVPFD